MTMRIQEISDRFEIMNLLHEYNCSISNVNQKSSLGFGAA
jgi:hypothetical protein